MRSHTERVGVLTWNSHTLTSGSQDSQIHNHDVRIAEHCVAQYLHHKLEVCGLRWSPDGSRLASGGNDNLACVWNSSTGVVEPLNVLTGHQAAVKVCICIIHVHVYTHDCTPECYIHVCIHSHNVQLYTSGVITFLYSVYNYMHACFRPPTCT